MWPSPPLPKRPLCFVGPFLSAGDCGTGGRAVQRHAHVRSCSRFMACDESLDLFRRPGPRARIGGTGILPVFEGRAGCPSPPSHPRFRTLRLAVAIEKPFRVQRSHSAPSLYGICILLACPYPYDRLNRRHENLPVPDGTGSGSGDNLFDYLIRQF